MGLAVTFMKEAQSLLTRKITLRPSTTLSPGSPPGELPNRPELFKPQVHVIAYDEHALEEKDITDLEEIPELLSRWAVVWVNVEGLGDSTVIARIGEIFGLHPLALEDVLALHQSPKAEYYDGHLYWVLRMLDKGTPAHTEQLNMFFNEHFVVTFQETPGDCLDCIRKRIREKAGRVRRMKADYLAYCLADAVVDFYFPYLDDLTERMEKLETEIIFRPKQKSMVELHQIKRDLLTIRRALAPLRETFSLLLRDDAKVFSDITRVYLRDGYDHVIQILELVETQREITSSLLEVYLTSVSNRTNDITKLLTIIATVFIPLSFLTGIYGMNFDVDASPYNMPELRWRYGYVGFLLVALIVALIELFLFWRKGWFRSSIEIDEQDKTR